MAGEGTLEALSTIPDIIRQPATNPTAALLIVLIAVTLFAIFAFTVLLLVHRSAPRRAPEAADYPAEDPDEPFVPVRDSDPLGKRAVFAVSGLVVFLAVLWALAGVTTQHRVACESCHLDNPHAVSERVDPHAEVWCVSCHEYGSRLALATVNTVERLAHMAVGRFEGLPGISAMGYGRPAASMSCKRCHAEELEAVSHNPALAIRMSHAEPLAEGAECTDCHRLRRGVVSSHTVGMATCLRCHDGVDASAACDFCHTGDTALAVRTDRDWDEVLPRRQVSRPQCETCHDDQAACDECHGVRLPHSEEFVLFAHAREGAIDLWERDGAVCSSCHDGVSQRACSDCHEPFLAHGAGFAGQHGQGVSFSEPGCSCHERAAHRTGRNFCELCHAERPDGAAP